VTEEMKKDQSNARRELWDTLDGIWWLYGLFQASQHMKNKKLGKDWLPSAKF
jgi:hypothetical protein